MKLTLVDDSTERKCVNPECSNGGIPCDCTTKAGKPRAHCRVTGSPWIRSHPCPDCIGVAPILDNDPPF